MKIGQFRLNHFLPPSQKKKKVSIECRLLKRPVTVRDYFKKVLFESRFPKYSRKYPHDRLEKITRLGEKLVGSPNIFSIRHITGLCPSPLIQVLPNFYAKQQKKLFFTTFYTY